MEGCEKWQKWQRGRLEWSDFGAAHLFYTHTLQYLNPDLVYKSTAPGKAPARVQTHALTAGDPLRMLLCLGHRMKLDSSTVPMYMLLVLTNRCFFSFLGLFQVAVRYEMAESWCELNTAAVDSTLAPLVAPRHSKAT